MYSKARDVIWHTVYFHSLRDDDVSQAPVGADSS